MSSTLVAGITDVFRTQVAGPFAANTGESESSVIRGFETSIGTMVESMAAKFRQTGSAGQLFDLINSPANDTRVLDNPRSLVGSQQGDNLTSRFTSTLFGNKLSSVTNEISSASGIRGGTAASLLTVGAPLLLGTLRKRVSTDGMDASRLTRFLSTEADGVRGSLPARVESLITSDTRVGESVPPVASAVVEERSRPPVATAVVPQKSRAWLWPLLGLIALGLLFWWLSTRRAAVNAPAAIPAASVPTANMVTRTLPGNVNLRFPDNGIESRLLNFIQDTSRPVDQTTWFDFDRILFDTNSATLLPSSTEQLQNIAAILKAYPNVHVKIGGYTDNTGNPAANMTLSQQRADAVRQQLVSMGISSDRIEAQGYGDQYPVGDNSTDAGRQQNRRISLRVTQK